MHVAHDQKRSRLEFLQAISDSRSKAAETMAKSLYAKACDKAKNAAEKQRKTLGASENKIMLTTEVIGETPPQDIAATICQLVNLPVRSALSKTAANAGASKLNVITAKLDTLAASQDAADTTDRLAVAGILDAIKNQTNAMQQQALPAPKVANADAQTYIHERRPDIELDMCVDPMEPKKKGFLTEYPVGAFDFCHSGGVTFLRQKRGERLHMIIFGMNVPELILLGIVLACALIAKGIGEKKGYGAGLSFCAGLFLGPLGIIIMAVVPDKSGQNTIASADALVKYKQLLDDGAITQEEFDAKKKELLATKK